MKNAFQRNMRFILAILFFSTCFLGFSNNITIFPLTKYYKRLKEGEIHKGQGQSHLAV
jgi:hypothetical protein